MQKTIRNLLLAKFISRDSIEARNDSIVNAGSFFSRACRFQLSPHCQHKPVGRSPAYRCAPIRNGSHLVPIDLLK